MTRRAAFLIGVVVAVLILGVFAFRRLDAPVADTDAPMVVRLKWLHQAQFAGFYEAAENGLYTKAGLNIRIEQGGPDFPAIKMVAAGGEQFGVTGADQILLARSQGVDVVPLMVIYRESPFLLFARAASGIKSPKDFAGHTIGVKLGGNEELIYRALLRSQSISVATKNEVPVQFDLTPFVAGAVDVWPGYAINEPLSASDQGIPVTLIRPADFGISLYADTLFTTGDMIRAHPEAVRKFVEATRAGWAQAVADPAAAGKAAMTYAPTSTLMHQTEMMKASLPYIKPDAAPIGSMSAEGWKRTQTLLIDGKFLEKPVDIDAMLVEAKKAGAILQ